MPDPTRLLAMGQRLRAHREQLGKTQAEVAEDLNRILWDRHRVHAGTNFDTVSKHERGERRPWPLTREAYRVLYSASDEDLGLTFPARGRGAQVDGAHGNGTPSRLEWWELTHALQRSRIGKRALSQLEGKVAGLAVSYPQTPPAALQESVFEHLGKMVDLLGGSLPVDHRRRLVIVTSELAGIAGNLLFDLNSDGEARQSFATAIVAAEEADDHDLHAWALATQSLIPTYNGRHLEALGLIEQAQQVADGHVSVSRSAWLHALEAKAHAGLGHAARCEELLGGAWQFMQAADASPRRPGIDFFDAPRLKGVQGACMLLLKRPRAAQPVLAEVLDLRDVADLKGRTLVQIDLAVSHVQERDYKLACRMLRDVLQIPRESLVEPIMRQVGVARSALAPWGGTPEVGELDEQLRGAT